VPKTSVSKAKRAFGEAINMKSITLTRCPRCGSRNIRHERKSFRARVGTRVIVVPDIEREICPDCKEEFFDREANIAIDAYCFGKKRQHA
jgi:YgiT-type zinc finger domain-containing protein